jgi:hypothetical protein
VTESRRRRPCLTVACAFLSALLPLPSFAQPSAAPAPTPWWQRVTFTGDLRVRDEAFYQQDMPTRHRAQLRVRFGARVPVNDDLDFSIRLTTGDPKVPTVPNQPLGGVLSRKPFYLDQFVLVYRPRAARALTLGAGKFGYPVLRTELTWDNDLNWEGAYEQLAFAAGRATLRLAAVQSVFSEVAAGPDTNMFGEQGLVVVKLGRHELQAALASYAFRRVDGIALALAAGDLRTHNTNALRTDAAGAVVGYQSEFRLVDAVAQATMATPRADYPVTLLADWVVNTAGPADRNHGLWVEAGYGRAAKPRTWRAAYRFVRIEREAVLSAYNFSEMYGTNVRGSCTLVSYAPAPRIALEFEGFFSRWLTVAPAAPNPLLKRLHAVVRVTF